MVPMATARSVGNGVITMSPNRTYRRVVAVLLDCSKSSRQCSLPSLLTYLLGQVLVT